MASVVQPILEPDAGAIAAHLATLFAPCAGEYPQGLVEIAHGSPGPDRANLFPITKEGMAEAVVYAIEQNRRGDNVYVGVNPRKPRTIDNKRANARDVEIAFWHFADLDHEEVVTLARSRIEKLRPTMVVLTGTKPANRPHLYWRLEEPVANLEEWTARQRGIAQALGGDMVIDPPRVMRLAGCVSYPSQDKLQRGYAVELVTIKTEFADERPPVSPSQITTAYPQQATPESGVAYLPEREGETTLSAMVRSTSATLIAACQAGNEWHNSMVRLVAHLAAIGTPTPVILGLAGEITLSGYMVEDTRRDMLKALRGAREKWGIPEPEEKTEESALESRESVYPSLSLDELENLPPPTYLIDDLIPEHGLTIVYGDPGAKKSFLVLDMALRVAHGMDWHGAEAGRVGVLYIAGEGKHGLGLRVRGWKREHALQGVPAPFKLIPVAVHLLDRPSLEKLKRTITEIAVNIGFDIGLVIIDTVSRAIAGQDENKQEAMSLFVDGCAEIQDFTGGAVIGVHHSGKDKDRGMRGSSVLLGGCDAAIRVTKDEQQSTLEVEKQKDAEEKGPFYMAFKEIEWSEGLKKVLKTLVPERATKLTTEQRVLSRRQADEIFRLVDEAWAQGNAWSAFPQAKRKGRYLVDYISAEYGVSARVAENHLTGWQTRGYMKSEAGGSKQQAGLRVLKYLEEA